MPECIILNTRAFRSRKSLAVQVVVSFELSDDDLEFKAIMMRTGYTWG